MIESVFALGVYTRVPLPASHCPPSVCRGRRIGSRTVGLGWRAGRVRNGHIRTAGRGGHGHAPERGDGRTLRGDCGRRRRIPFFAAAARALSGGIAARGLQKRAAGAVDAECLGSCGARSGAGTRRRGHHGRMSVPCARRNAVHRHAGRSEDHHRGAAQHAQLHPGAVDVVGFGCQREQRRHAGARHAQRQRERQHHRGRLYRRRRLRPQHGAESRRHLPVQDPDVAKRCHVRRHGSQHQPDDQTRREQLPRRPVGVCAQRHL